MERPTRTLTASSTAAGLGVRQCEEQCDEARWERQCTSSIGTYPREPRLRGHAARIHAPQYGRTCSAEAAWTVPHARRLGRRARSRDEAERGEGRFRRRARSRLRPASSSATSARRLAERLPQRCLRGARAVHYAERRQPARSCASTGGAGARARHGVAPRRLLASAPTSIRLRTLPRRRSGQADRPDAHRAHATRGRSAPTARGRSVQPSTCLRTRDR